MPQFKCLVLAAFALLLHLSSTSGQTQTSQKYEFKDRITEEELNKELIKSKNIELHELFLFRPHELHNETQGVLELNRLSLQAKLYYGVYNDLMMQRYDSFNELKKSGGPAADQELCLRHLRNLNERVEVQEREKYSSKDVNLAQLLTTFGRVSSSLYLGDHFYPGAYEECQRLQVESPDGQVPTRYCVAHVKHRSWLKRTTPLDRMTAMKSGVCLPKSCDSLDYKNKFKLILRLIEWNMREIDRNQNELTDLYCLPDSQSPLRTWWLQPKTVIIVICLAIWILIQIYATFKRDATGIFKSLSIKHNLAILLKTSNGKGTDAAEQQTSLNESADQVEKRAPIVDIKVVEGIKVIAQMFIIMGHVLMMLPHIINNNREDGWNYSPMYFLSNMSPGYAVNAFFSITGFLTTYLMFKQQHLLSSITKPTRWIFIVLHRYFRMMPMYVVVVIYAKYLAKYTGSGPFWDYGTSSMAHRRNCEEESWIWTLLFGANFKPVLRHCIPTAWYLANDFHFFIITPIFLAILHKHSKLGSRLIKVIVTLSSLKSFYDVYTSEFDNMKAISRYEPHGFKLYSTFLAHNYTSPYNRICVYLSGMLLGRDLYKHEKRRLEYWADKEKGEIVGREPGWSDFMAKRGLKVSALLLSLCFFVAPIVGIIVPLNEQTSKFLLSIMLARGHMGCGIAFCIYIMLASTGNGIEWLDRFLSSKFWRPLARLSLCVMLVNVEVIIYITQTKTHIMYLDNVTHLSLIILSILASYLAAAAMFVLFEAPIRAVFGHLFRRSSNKGSKERSKKE